MPGQARCKPIQQAGKLGAAPDARAVPAAQLRGLIIGGTGFNIGHAKVFGHLKDVVVPTLSAPFMDGPQFVAPALAVLGMAQADARAVIAAGVSLRAVPAASRSLLYVDFLATLAAIPQPVLIVNGTLDARAMSQEARFLAGAPQGSVYHFENSMHGVPGSERHPPR